MKEIVNEVVLRREFICLSHMFQVECLPVMNSLNKKDILWDQNQVISISLLKDENFIEKKWIEYEKKIKQATNEWEKFCNISFEFVGYDDYEAIVRIKFVENVLFSCSFGCGMELLNYPKQLPNLILGGMSHKGSEANILHQFGHVLGFDHVHFHPDTIQRKQLKENLAPETDTAQKLLYECQKFYEEECNMKWESNLIKRNLFSDMIGPDYQEKKGHDHCSIMLLNLLSVQQNYLLSDIDKKKISELYPKQLTSSKKVDSKNGWKDDEEDDKGEDLELSEEFPSGLKFKRKEHNHDHIINHIIKKKPKQENQGQNQKKIVHFNRIGVF